MKRFLVVLFAVLTLFSVMSCKKKDVTEKSAVTGSVNLPELKVATIPFLNSIPIKYMMDHKLDEKNGFKIVEVPFVNGVAMNEALAADQWEVGTLSAAAVNSLAIYGAYCVADIGHSEGGLYTLASKDSVVSKIKGANPSYPDVYGDAATLKGKSIAVTTGTISHLNVVKWVEALGLTIDDVKILSMDFPAAYTALTQGRVDIAALNPPTSYQAEAEGYTVTSSLSSLKVPQFDSIIASAKVVEKRPEILTNYIKAFYEATDALQSDPNMAAKALLDWYTANGTKSNLEACAAEIKTRPFVTSEEAKNIVVGESVQITAEFWVSQGLLQEAKFPEVAKHVSGKFVASALAK